PVCTRSLDVHNLLFPPTHFINALPLLRHTFPPATLVTNRTSSQPSFTSPVRHICVTNRSPGLTGLANLAENSLMFTGSLPPRCFNSCMRRRVPAKESLHDHPAEPHLLSRLGCCVE